MRALAAALALAVPVAALAFPLLPAQDRPERGSRDEGGRDEGGEEIEDRLAPLPRSPAPERRRARARVSGPERERGAPFLVPIGDGRAWLGCLEWEGGAGDRIVVRELDAAANVQREIVVQDAAAEIVRPVGALDGEGRLHVLWTELVGEAPQIRFARLEGEGFAAARTLTNGPSNTNVEAVRHADGRVWLAWESFRVPEKGEGRGSVDVLLAPLAGEEGEELGPITPVGEGRGSDLDAVLASQGGRLAIAWTSFLGRDYDVLLRTFDPKTAVLSPVLNVTCDGSSDDLHPALVAGTDGELWVAWDRLEDSTRGTSLPETLRPPARGETHTVFVMAARVRGERVELPAAPQGWPAGAVAGAPRLSWMGGVPRLALAADGRPWIAYRYLDRQPSGRVLRFGEPVLVHRFGESGWSPAIEVEESIGYAEEPALIGAGAGVLCAGQQDLRLQVTRVWNGSSAPEALRAAMKTRDVDIGTWYGPTGIFVARLEGAPAAPKREEGAPAPAAFVERPDRRAIDHFHPSGAALADPFVSGERHHEVRRGEQTWRVYWGDLHRHSSISRCARGFEPMPPQRYEFGRDVHLYDFMAMTDHAGQIDPFSWWQLDKLCWLFRTPRFCPIAGFESSTQQFGHHNVILDGRLTPLVSLVSQHEEERFHQSRGLHVLYSRLDPQHAITIPHTPADGGRRVVFGQCDPGLTRLVEIYQALRGNYEFEGCLRQSTLANAFGSFAHDALNQGLKVGFIASTDHGNGASYAGVLAERLDPRGIFEALKARRAFGATTKGLLVDFRIGDAVMGEEIAGGEPPRVRVKVVAPAEIAEVVVFRNGRPWRALGRAPAFRPEATVGATLELEPPFKAKRAEEDWTLALTVAGGQWLDWPAGRRPPRSADGGGGFAADGETVRFRWPAGFLGFKPGDLRVRLRARRDAKVTVLTGGEPRELRVSALIARGLHGQAGAQTWRITAYERYDELADLEKGLGVLSLEHEWIDDDPPAPPSWYYARAVLKNGEMAWSSPIFVDGAVR